MEDLSANATASEPVESPGAGEPAADQSESQQDQPSGSRGKSTFDFSAIMRAGRSTSKPDGDSEGDSSGDSGSRSNGGDRVKPSGSLGRRGSAAEIERLAKDNEALKARLASYESRDGGEQPPDPDSERRKAAVERETRYKTLLRKPAANLTQEEFDWLETEKELREKFPDVVQHFDSILDEERKSLRENHEAEVGRFWTDLRSEIATTLAMPGLTDADRDALRSAKSWIEHVRIHRDAEARVQQAEIRRLKQEIRDLRTQSLTSARTPVAAGRSGGAPSPEFDMNRFLRGF